MKKEELQQIVNNTKCGIVLTDDFPNGDIIFANNYFYELLGYTVEEFNKKYNHKITGLIRESERQKMKALMSRQMTAGGDINIEFQIESKNADMLWVKLNIRSVDMGDYVVYACTIFDINYSKVLLEDAFRSKKDLSLIANNIPGGVIKLRMTDFYIKYANDGFFRLAGYSRQEYEDLFLNRCNNMIHPDDQPNVNNAVKAAVENGGMIGMEYRIIAKDGQTRWSYVNGTRVDDEDGELVYLCVIMDITARKRAESAIIKNKRYISEIATLMGFVAWMYDVKTEILTRYGDLENSFSVENSIKSPYDIWGKKVIHPDDFKDFSSFYKRLISTNEKIEMLVRLKNLNGNYNHVRITAVGSEDEENGHDIVFGVTRIVDDEIKKLTQKSSARHTKEENRLIRMAKSARADMRDAVTGFPTYSKFIKSTEKMFKEVEENNQEIAIICADINDFHRYNQHYGFSRSNDILRKFSDTLQKTLATDDMCARVDGDYFVTAFRYDKHKELLKALTDMIDSIEIIESSDDYLNFDISIGVYIKKDGDEDLLRMLEKADLSRRSLKGLKGSHYVIYTDDLQDGATKEAEEIEDIISAMRDHKMEVRYMPRIMDDRSNIIGCKAIPSVLLRDGSYIDYTKILRIMEKTTKLEDFGIYLISDVANNLGAWKGLGNEVIPVSIALSNAQLSSPNVVKRINKIIKINNLEPDDFIFEIPEKYFADRTTGFELSVKELANSGYSVIISRFGTYNMDISSLRTLPINGIKFHGEYFNEHMTNKRDKIMLHKIVEMCNEMGLMVHCGTVNTKLQEKFAREIGCRVFEGDSFYPPAKPRVFEKCYLGDTKYKE